MDKESFNHGSHKDSFRNGSSKFHSEKEGFHKSSNEYGNPKESAMKKKEAKSGRSMSPEKPGSSEGKYKERKKKPNVNQCVSDCAATNSPKFGKNSKKHFSKEGSIEYPDLQAKMNSEDNMRKGSKQNRRTSVPKVTEELKTYSNASSSQSPSSCRTGSKLHKMDSKFRSKTPEAKGATGYSKGVHAKKIKFEPYIPLFQVQQGLKRGEFIEGALRINPRNYEDAYVNSPDGKMDIYIGGMQNRNRALNGDSVVVQINPKQEWKVLCDAIKDYQEKCGKTFVDTICEPATPTVPCQVHTPDPFVRPRPLSSNSWDNARSKRSPDTLEILGIDKLAEQFKNISVTQKASSKPKSKRKNKSSKHEKSSSQKSSTAF